MGSPPKSPADLTEDIISFKPRDAPPPSERSEPEPTVPISGLGATRKTMRRGLSRAKLGGALRGGALRGGAKRVTKSDAEPTDSIPDIAQAAAESRTEEHNNSNANTVRAMCVTRVSLECSKYH